MKSRFGSVVVALVPVAVVAAHGVGDHQHIHARQTTGTPVANPATFTFSLASTNPTAVPLTQITAGQPSAATRPLDTPAVAGAKPTAIPGAPALPNLANFKGSDYPEFDAIPPVDSPEVQQWKKEVAESGIVIPDLTPTVPGGCASNAAIATEPGRCWWTCTGCVEEKDITQCPERYSWGLTYDDGPGYYTSNLMHYLDEQKLKASFYVVGSRVKQFPEILQAQYMSQHEIGIHTWSHKALTTLTNDEIIAELGWTRKIIKDVLGVTPNTMRPPQGDIDARVRAISYALGLTPVMWTRTSVTTTFDTDDFNVHSGQTPVQKVLQNWQNILSQASQMDHGFIALEHDVHQETVEVATGYILPDALAHQPAFKIQPVGICLGRALSDSYVETNNNQTNPPPVVYKDGGASSAAPQQHSNPTMITALIIGVSGFAAGLFTTLRL